MFSHHLRRGSIIVLLVLSLSVVGCAKGAVIIEYDQLFLVKSVNTWTFPVPNSASTVETSGGVWVVYDIRRITNTGKNATLFQLVRDNLTTSAKTTVPPDLQSYGVIDELQTNVTTLPSTITIFPGDAKDINARVVLLAKGNKNDLVAQAWIPLHYYDPQRSILVVHHSPLVQTKILDHANYADFK